MPVNLSAPDPASLHPVPGVRLVDDETRLAPEAKPFTWSAERDVVRLTLSGNAPLPLVKGRLVEAAKAALGNVEVADQMGLARGAPPRFDAAALLLLDQIGKLKEGKLAIADDKVSLSGMARELGGREAIAAALKNLPEGFSVASNEIKAPPYVFQAYKDPVANTLTLTGNVPDKNVHAALVAVAGRRFFSEKVVDNLKESIGAPAMFAAVVVPALGALSRLSTGTLVVTDREVKLSGDALYDAAAAQIRAGLGKDFPQNWQYKAEITVKPPSAPVDNTVCQQLFADLLAKARIRFETGKADLSPDSLGLLDRLTETTVAYLRDQVAAGAEALQLFEKVYGPDDKELFMPLLLVGNMRREMGDLRGAEAVDLRAVEIANLAGFIQAGAPVIVRGSSQSPRPATTSRARPPRPARISGRCVLHRSGDGAGRV